MTDLSSSFKAQFFDPPAPDFEIRVGEHAWRIHIDLFAEKSDFFRALRDSNFKETSERCVIFQDEHEVAVALFLLWVYFGEYPVYADCGVEGMSVNDMKGVLDLRITTPTVGQDSSMSMGSQSEDSITTANVSNSGPSQPANPNQPQTPTQPPIPPQIQFLDGQRLREMEIGTHWRMYMLADKYGCPELKVYCLKHLFAVTQRDLKGIWGIVDRANAAEIAVPNVQEEIIKFFKLHFTFFARDLRFEDLVKTTPELAWTLVSEYGRHRLGQPI